MTPFLYTIVCKKIDEQKICKEYLLCEEIEHVLAETAGDAFQAIILKHADDLKSEMFKAEEEEMEFKYEIFLLEMNRYRSCLVAPDSQIIGLYL